MRSVVIVVCFLILVFPFSSVAQESNSVTLASAQAPNTDQFGGRTTPESPGEREIERKMAKERNKERQKELKQDTDKLLKLATELKQYVDKTNENILSVDVLKKTDEIEKLAKSVHDKMKAGNYGPQ